LCRNRFEFSNTTEINTWENLLYMSSKFTISSKIHTRVDTEEKCNKLRD
jgi:hypothetical protein